MKNRANVHRSVLDLLAQVDQTLGFVESVNISPDKLSRFEDTISKVPSIIGGCCQFMETYILRQSSGGTSIFLLFVVIYAEFYHAGHLVRQAITEESDQFAHYSKTLSQLQLELTNNVISQILTVGKKSMYICGQCELIHSTRPVTDNKSKSEDMELPSGSKIRNHNVPGPTSAFTGREDILKQLTEYFNPTTASVIRGMQRLFVLWGLGGAGKTQIALKFATMQRNQCVVLNRIYYVLTCILQILWDLHG